MKMRVISNLHTLGDTRRDDLTIDLYKYPKGRNKLSTLLSIHLKSFRYDYLLLNLSTAELTILAFFNLIMPFNRCKIVALDHILRVPTTLRDKAVQLAKIILLKKVHIFIEYFRNTEGYQRYFHIHAARFRYIPFKVNSYEVILKKTTSDKDYIFCGGKTLRDFDTLIEAAKDLSYPVKIVAPDNAELTRHRSFLDESALPPNISVVRHDGAQESFIQCIADARLVVLPIKKQNISASGISVYLMCMALKKCVIISAGPGVDDVLTDNQAIIVPPEDPEALREAIVKAYNDNVYRNQIAKNGYNYATRLGGEKQLVDSVREVLVRDFVESRKGDS